MRSQRKLTLAHRFPVPPVTPSYSPFVSEPLRERFITTVWQLNSARSPKSASERAPRTDPPRRGEDQECVCALKQEVVVDVVAVNDPPLASKQDALFLEELVLRHPNPPRIPTMEIEAKNRKAGPLREHPRKCAFSSAGHASHDNAASDNGRWVNLVHGAQELLIDEPKDGKEIERSRAAACGEKQTRLSTLPNPTKLRYSGAARSRSARSDLNIEIGQARFRRPNPEPRGPGTLGRL